MSIIRVNFSINTVLNKFLSYFVPLLDRSLHCPRICHPQGELYKEAVSMHKNLPSSEKLLESPVSPFIHLYSAFLALIY